MAFSFGGRFVRHGAALGKYGAQEGRREGRAAGLPVEQPPREEFAALLAQFMHGHYPSYSSR